MLRRIVVLTLVPLLLLSGIGLAHPHAGAVGSNRELLPHIHLSFLRLSADSAANDLKSPGWNAPAADHDEDAVYLPGSGTPAQTEQASATDRAASSFLGMIPPAVVLLVPLTASLSPLPRSAHIPSLPDLHSLPLLI